MAKKTEAEGYSEDVTALHTGGATGADTNKFDYSGSGAPGPQTVFPASPSFGENDFPRETGSDSMGSGDDLVILGG